MAQRLSANWAARIATLVADEVNWRKPGLPWSRSSDGTHRDLALLADSLASSWRAPEDADDGAWRLAGGCHSRAADAAQGHWRTCQAARAAHDRRSVAGHAAAGTRPVLRGRARAVGAPRSFCCRRLGRRAGSSISPRCFLEAFTWRLAISPVIACLSAIKRAPVAALQLAHFCRLWAQRR